MYLWINRIISSSLVTTTSNPSTVHRDLCATARSPQRARLDLLAGAKCGRQGRGMCTQSGAYIYTLNRRLCYTSTFFNLSTAQDSPSGIHSPVLAVSSLLYGFVESYITSPGTLTVREVLLFVDCTHKPPASSLTVFWGTGKCWSLSFESQRRDRTVDPYYQLRPRAERCALRSSA